jgi:hypothetical protein
LKLVKGLLKEVEVLKVVIASMRPKNRQPHLYQKL